MPDLRKHLDALPSGAPLVLTSPEGTALSSSNFRRRVWLPALDAVGLSEIHIHDCAIPVTSSLPTQARTPGSSWRGWVTTVLALR